MREMREQTERDFIVLYLEREREREREEGWWGSMECPSKSRRWQ